MKKSSFNQAAIQGIPGNFLGLPHGFIVLDGTCGCVFHLHPSFFCSVVVSHMIKQSESR